MRIQKYTPVQGEAKSQNTNQQHRSYTPSFKAGGLNGSLNFFGMLMQWIEDGGFLMSFLIQDSIGMTAPRAAAGFLRDKEVTGKYNKQEGFEVLGREGLTGPIMMAMAPLMFALAAKTGRSTSVNSQLIKRYGNNFKKFIANPEFDKNLLTNKDKFKHEFYASNIREILSNSLGKDNVKEESIEFILKQISHYEKIPTDVVLPKNFIGIKSKAKYRKQCLEEISNHINNIRYSTSNDLSMLNKVQVGAAGDIKTYDVVKAIDGLVKYSDDAISLNKNLSKMNEAAAENLKNASLAKRLITNVTTMFATLGVLSVLPNLYIRSDISPGARTAMHMREVNEALENEKAQAQKEAGDSKNNTEDVSFKGKKPKQSWLVSLGKKIAKLVDKDFYSKELEYNGRNFTNTLMEVLSIFGLLAPRGLKAYSRAQVDENGKKDLTELYEIFLRDFTSSIAVVFAVPMMTRSAISAYENKSGFVLLHKDRTKSKLATALDLINPYSKTHVLTNSEIKALYNGVDTNEKMINFCNYINKNDGDLEKIFSKSEYSKEAFRELNFNTSELSNLSKKDKNSKIISFFENLAKDNKIDKKKIEQSIAKLMKGSSKPDSNKILSFARGLNSIPGVIATIFISPCILGWAIPRLTYANTRKIHEKAEKQRQENIATINTAV